MKLPDFIAPGPLDSIRRAMGAPLLDFRMPAPQFKPIAIVEPPEQLSNVGIDVGSDEIETLSDGTLAYQGYRVLVYIRDVRTFQGELKLPRFHLAWCETLDKMTRGNRFERYVVANRDDGVFVVHLEADPRNARTERLRVCQHCLSRLDWEGFKACDQTTRRQRVEVFSLRKFFERYPKDLVSRKPKYASDVAPPNEYPENWAEIADAMKRRAGHRCSTCGLTLPVWDRKFLHVHHRNGLRNDCTEANLAVLCLKCHTEQPMHAFMRSTREYREFASRYP